MSSHPYLFFLSMPTKELRNSDVKSVRRYNNIWTRDADRKRRSAKIRVVRLLTKKTVRVLARDLKCFFEGGASAAEEAELEGSPCDK